MSKIIKEIIKARRNGRSMLDSIYSVSNREMKKKLPCDIKKPYSEKDLIQLKKILYPIGFGKKFRPFNFLKWGVLKRIKRKRIDNIFKSDKMGLLVIKPEMVPFSSSVRSFLSSIGCDVVISQVIVMSLRQVERIYSTEMKKWKDFSVNFLLYTNSPSKIIVFKHTSREKYLEIMKKVDSKRYALMKDKLKLAPLQEVFQWAIKGQMDEGCKGTLRGDTTYKKLKKFGILDMQGVGEFLDPTGYLKARVLSGRKINNILTGIHSPSNLDELITHAETLLSVSDLSNLEKKIK